MKTYLVVTGSIFGLLGVAHLVRLFVEGRADPLFLAGNLAIFGIGVGVAVWAGLLLRRATRVHAL